MQMRAYDENRSVYRISRDPKRKATPIPYYLQKKKRSISLVSDVLRANNLKLEPQSGVSQRARPWGPAIFQTRHEIFNGGELNRDGKVNFLISGDASLPAASVESAGKGKRGVAHLCHLPRYLANPPPPRPLEISRQPLPAISHPRNEPPSPRTL